jgi:hypothetical protein
MENESCICHKEGRQPLKVAQLCGITTISSTLGMPVSVVLVVGTKGGLGLGQMVVP